jgi:2-dehydropantoate 2-reductase
MVKKQSFQCHLPGEKNFRLYRTQVFSDLGDCDTPDVVVIGVKSYALDEVVQQIQQRFGTEIPVMSVLNGVRHVELLRSVFSKCIFATIGYNAYRTGPDKAVAIGGSVVLSSTDNSMPVVDEMYRTLKAKIGVRLAENPLNVAHCKLVINLGNALLTMVAFHKNREREIPELHKVASTMLVEGIKVMRKAGVKEVRIPSMPPWFLIQISAVLPSFIGVALFNRKMAGSSINSMAQDILSGSKNTELEDINGYFLQLAAKEGIDVPYNQAVYDLFKTWVEGNRQPLRPSEVLSAVNSVSNR